MKGGRADSPGLGPGLQVVAVSVHEGEVGQYDVALLELDRDDAVSSMPVCLDLGGTVLQNISPGDMGLVRHIGSAGRGTVSYWPSRACSLSYALWFRCRALTTIFEL